MEENGYNEIVWSECRKTSSMEIRTTSIMQRRHNLKRAQIVKLYIIAQKSVSIAHVWTVNGITVWREVHYLEYPT